MDAVDIRDITGPMTIPDLWVWALPALAVLLATALLLLAVRAWRRRARSAATAEARALARLAEARDLMHPDRAREYGFAVSEAVRLYIEERFAARAAHRTTEEFLRELAGKEASPLAGRRPLLERFLQHCDLAKFARFALTADDMEALHASALRFVHEAREVGPSAR